MQGPSVFHKNVLPGVNVSHSRIRLVKDVEILVGSHLPRFLNAGQKFELVQGPAINPLVCFGIAVKGSVCLHLLLVNVVLILFVFAVGVGQVADNVNDFVSAIGALEVGKDEQLARRKAGADAVHARLEALAVLAVARLEDGLDGGEHVAGEAFAELLGRRVGNVHADGLELARGREVVRAGDLGEHGQGRQRGALADAGPVVPEQEHDYDDEAARGNDEVAVDALVEQRRVQRSRRRGLAEEGHCRPRRRRRLVGERRRRRRLRGNFRSGGCHRTLQARHHVTIDGCAAVTSDCARGTNRRCGRRCWSLRTKIEEKMRGQEDFWRLDQIGGLYCSHGGQEEYGQPWRKATGQPSLA